MTAVVLRLEIRGNSKTISADNPSVPAELTEQKMRELIYSAPGFPDGLLVVRISEDKTLDCGEKAGLWKESVLEKGPGILSDGIIAYTPTKKGIQSVDVYKGFLLKGKLGGLIYRQPMKKVFLRIVSTAILPGVNKVVVFQWKWDTDWWPQTLKDCGLTTRPLVTDETQTSVASFVSKGDKWEVSIKNI